MQLYVPCDDYKCQPYVCSASIAFYYSAKTSHHYPQLTIVIITVDTDFCLPQDGMDLTNFNAFNDEEVTENEGFRDEEVEMSDKNTVRLLVTADDASQF